MTDMTLEDSEQLVKQARAVQGVGNCDGDLFHAVMDELTKLRGDTG